MSHLFMPAGGEIEKSLRPRLLSISTHRAHHTYIFVNNLNARQSRDHEIGPIRMSTNVDNRDIANVIDLWQTSCDGLRRTRALPTAFFRWRGVNAGHFLYFETLLSGRG